MSSSVDIIYPPDRLLGANSQLRYSDDGTDGDITNTLGRLFVRALSGNDLVLSSTADLDIRTLNVKNATGSRPFTFESNTNNSGIGGSRNSYSFGTTGLATDAHTIWHVIGTSIMELAYLPIYPGLQTNTGGGLKAVPNIGDSPTWTGTHTFNVHPLGLDHTQIANIGSNTHATIDSHIASTANPHTVTLTQAEAAGGAITEGAITDGSILARIASNETISGTWQFNSTITSIASVAMAADALTLNGTANGANDQFFEVQDTGTWAMRLQDANGSVVGSRFLILSSATGIMGSNGLDDALYPTNFVRFDRNYTLNSGSSNFSQFKCGANVTTDGNASLRGNRSDASCIGNTAEAGMNTVSGGNFGSAFAGSAAGCRVKIFQTGGEFQSNVTHTGGTGVRTSRTQTITGGIMSVSLRGSGYDVPTAAVLQIQPPTAAGSYGTSIALSTWLGIWIRDQEFTTTNPTSDASAIYINSQTCNDATEGNIRFLGGAWNTGHINFGSDTTGVHIWGVSGDLRYKDGNPSSDSDWIVNMQSSGLEIGDTFDLLFATSGTGSNIGQGTTALMGFWGVTPIVQPASGNQAALTNSTGGTTDSTISAVSGSGDDGTINNNLAELFVLQNAMRDALVNSGIMKGAA